MSCLESLTALSQDQNVSSFIVPGGLLPAPVRTKMLKIGFQGFFLAAINVLNSNICHVQKHVNGKKGIFFYSF
jgi:hypothetical protein